MKKFHIPLAVPSITISVQECSQRLRPTPDLIITDHYALRRTAALNFSITMSSNAPALLLRHFDREVTETDWFSVEKDCTAIARECVTARQQAAGITQNQPDGSYHPTLDRS